MHDTGIIVRRVVRIDGLPLLFKKGVFPTWKTKRKKEKMATNCDICPCIGGLRQIIKQK